MSAADLYFYHAPDDRIYGPVTRESLLLWEQQGRLTAASKLQLKGGTVCTTWGEVRAALPPPAQVPPPAEQVVAPEPAPPAEAILEFPSIPAILRESVSSYGRYLGPLLLLSAALQLPAHGIVFLISRLKPLESAGGAGSEGQSLFITFFVSFGAAVVVELAIGLMASLLQQAQENKLPGLRQLLSLIPGILFPVSLTYLLRLVLPALGILPALMFWSAAVSQHQNKAPSLVVALLFLMGCFLLIVPFLLVIRYLLSTLVIVLEGRPGFSALNRSNTLIRYNPGATPFTSGELKLLLLLLIPIALTVACNLLSLRLLGFDFNSLTATTASVPPHPKVLESFLSQLVMFVAGTLIVPFYATIMYHFYQHTTQHVEEV